MKYRIVKPGAASSPASSFTAFLILFSQAHDFERVTSKLGWYAFMRFSNPTGHYEFNLSTLVHKHLASRLKDQVWDGQIDP